MPMSSPYTFKPGGALKLKGDKSKKKKKSSTSAKPPHETADKSSSTKYATTKAEQKFEEVQRKRLREQARTEAHKSHKDKVDSFNAYLDSLSEHHDMPKIGPG